MAIVILADHITFKSIKIIIYPNYILVNKLMLDFIDTKFTNLYLCYKYKFRAIHK